jgi:hypothetical protein
MQEREKWTINDNCALAKYLWNAQGLLSYCCCHVIMTTLGGGQISALTLFVSLHVKTDTLTELDPQNIYWETRWPLFSLSDILENSQLHPSLQDVFLDDVVETINSFNDTQWLKFIDAIMSCNCCLVEVSPVRSACLRCNQNKPGLFYSTC